MTVTVHPWGWLLSEKPENESIGKDVRKLESLCAVDGNVKGVVTMENNMVVPQKIGSMWYRNSNFGCFTKRIESKVSKRYLYTHVSSQHHITAKRRSHLSVHWWMNNKQNITYIQWNIKEEWNSDTCCHLYEPWEYYAKWISQLEKDKYYIIWLIWSIWTSQILRNK